MSFLPKDYEQPKEEGNYYKLKKGENRFRVLSSAITGWEYWTRDNKPVRSKHPFEERPEDAKVAENGQYQKHFWAFVVYNYEAKKPQILEITQKTIMSSMGTYVDNAKWGDPKGYDLVVTAEGDGLEREYTVIAEPHSPAPEADISKIHLEALYESGDPFSSVPTEKASEVIDPMYGNGTKYPDEDINPEDVPF